MYKLDDDGKPPTQYHRDRYEASVKAYQFELDLFWKRSLFFWGIIGAAFVALSSKEATPRLQVMIASFGLVCSTVFTLVNRGSKFWYENWEEKVNRAEQLVTGTLYGEALADARKCFWQEWWTERLERKRFSPSKLAIALSDFTALLWLAILLGKSGHLTSEIMKRHFNLPCWLATPTLKDGLVLVFAAAAIIYSWTIIKSCRSSGNKRP